MNLRGAVGTLSLLAPLAAFSATWEIEPSHTNASFAVKHLMVSTVRGDMGKVTGTFELDEKDFAKSKLMATIDVKGLNTREAKRDEHLRSPEFFDVAKYPTMTFKSKKVEGAAGKFKVVGDLTIKDVTKEVTLNVEATDEVKDPWGNMKRGGVATAKINRLDYGLKWNMPLEKGGFLVGDEVTITIDIELQKKAAAPAPKKS